MQLKNCFYLYKTSYVLCAAKKLFRFMLNMPCITLDTSSHFRIGTYEHILYIEKLRFFKI